MYPIYKNVIKRSIDFTCALVAIIILSPLLFIIAIALAIEQRSSPFFVQLRPGINERIFKLVKFKSMRDVKDKDGKLLSNRERITRLGKILRTTSLDELPQLFNVLIGQMSLIGPRPLLPSYLPYYTTEERQRHLVKPGITGWAQVNGRNTLNWNDRIQADVYYVQNLSFKLDMIILFRTIKYVLIGKDVVYDEANFIGFDLCRQAEIDKLNH